MVQPELITGALFDIQGFSVHDGPGCRTLIFFKGCSLSCAWCCNPEGIHAFSEPLVNASKCSFDELCIFACPKQAITKNGNDLDFNRKVCRDCTTYDCISACCSGALRLGGYNIRMDELFEIIQRDRQYWGSEGGITMTGGEPFLQPEFAEQILEKCYTAYIHTAIETCGNVPWTNIERSLKWIDWIFYDLKQADDLKHAAMTSQGNSLILDNARRLAKYFEGRLIFRMPVIPGFNDGEDNIFRLSGFLDSIGKNEINILPLHHLGKEKFKLVGRGYYTDDLTIPTKEDLQKIKSLFESNGVHCYIGSDTPF
jgi:pyruvate formate lyase activating enzyme